MALLLRPSLFSCFSVLWRSVCCCCCCYYYYYYDYDDDDYYYYYPLEKVYRRGKLLATEILHCIYQSSNRPIHTYKAGGKMGDDHGGKHINTYLTNRSNCIADSLFVVLASQE